MLYDCYIMIGYKDKDNDKKHRNKLQKNHRNILRKRTEDMFEKKSDATTTKDEAYFLW